VTDREFMLYAFKGDAAAVDYVLMVARVADVWDNLIDKDVAVKDSDINDAFWILSVEIPGNAFYRRHMDDLLPVIKTGITNWMIANEIEKSPKSNLAIEISHVIRYSIADVVVMAALLSGGREWAATVGPELRLRSQRSDMAEYLNSLKAKQQGDGNAA
jgi:hypothetical protein